MLNLRSITPISRVIPTDGSRPVIVLANDYEDYVCKYDANNKLINEFIGHKFLQAWGLPTFPAAFVQIQRDHIPEGILNGRIKTHLFDKPAFGLQYDIEAIEATNTLFGLKGDYYELAKFSNKYDLMKIALFDLWLANDDRNHNNYNILVKSNQFIPIDHSNIFDGGGLGRELSQLTDNDSIITSDLALTFMNNRTTVKDTFNDLIVNFPIFVERCRKILPTIIKKIPDEWCSNKSLLAKNILSSVFDNDQWKRQTIVTFSELIHNFNH